MTTWRGEREVGGGKKKREREREGGWQLYHARDLEAHLHRKRMGREENNDTIPDVVRKLGKLISYVISKYL